MVALVYVVVSFVAAVLVGNLIYRGGSDHG